jgi:DNA-binding response OmpR family regulator
MSATKVLVVTNDRAFGEAVTEFLKDLVEVKAVSTSEEALDCTTRACPDVVLVDHDSSNMNCLDIISITRALRCRFECALVTSRPSESLSFEAARQGVTHILTKPVGRAELEELIGVHTAAYVQLRKPAGEPARARA